MSVVAIALTVQICDGCKNITIAGYGRLFTESGEEATFGTGRQNLDVEEADWNLGLKIGNPEAESRTYLLFITLTSSMLQ
jgi:hypothetical protein